MHKVSQTGKDSIFASGSSDGRCSSGNGSGRVLTLLRLAALQRMLLII